MCHLELTPPRRPAACVRTHELVCPRLAYVISTHDSERVVLGGKSHAAFLGAINGDCVDGAVQLDGEPFEIRLLQRIVQEQARDGVVLGYQHLRSLLHFSICEGQMTYSEVAAGVVVNGSSRQAVQVASEQGLIYEDTDG